MWRSEPPGRVLTVNPYQIETRDPESGHVRVVVDTPAGSSNKYKFNESTGLFEVARILPAGMSFPCDFGSIPSTRADDGDPLDAVVLGLAPAFAGCLVQVRLLGVLRAIQTEHTKKVRNDRLIGIALTPVNRSTFRSLRDLSPEQLYSIEQFFISYNRAQARDFRITGHAGAREAMAILRRAERNHQKRRA